MQDALPKQITTTNPNLKSNYYDAIHYKSKNPNYRLPTIEELKLLRKYNNQYFPPNDYLTCEELEIDSDKVKTYNIKYNKEGQPIKKTDNCYFILIKLDY
jgi:hypothetical protein